jgi:hypothetical protein
MKNARRRFKYGMAERSIIGVYSLFTSVLFFESLAPLTSLDGQI